VPESLDAYRYISYLRSRWRWIAAACALAVAIALGVTLTMPREYTATARIVIDPPAGADLRSAMAVSPIYLESLKTYEQFGASDSLFQKAIDKFGLRGEHSIESLKRHILKVAIVRNTRVLELSATLPDPRKAQALAQYLAESTVAMTRTLVGEGDRDLIAGTEQQQKELRDRVQEIDARWAHLLASEPVAELQAEMANDAKLRASLQEQVQNVELEIADNTQRIEQERPANVAEIRRQTANAQARLAELRRQLKTMDRQSAVRERLVAERLAHRDGLEAERKAAQTSLASAETRLREARGDAGYRGERLRVIDPGIVPERPSSPNLPLNVIAALLLALVLSALYFAFELAWQEQRIRRLRMDPVRNG